MLKRTTILMGVVSALLLSACGEKIPEPTAEVCIKGHPFTFAAEKGLSRAGTEEFIFQCRAFAARHPEIQQFEYNPKPSKKWTIFGNNRKKEAKEKEE
jgi:entry exclusion lipoprotein TrbK